VKLFEDRICGGAGPLRGVKQLQYETKTDLDELNRLKNIPVKASVIDGEPVFEFPKFYRSEHRAEQRIDRMTKTWRETWRNEETAYSVSNKGLFGFFSSMTMGRCVNCGTTTAHPPDCHVRDLQFYGEHKLSAEFVNKTHNVRVKL